MSRLRDGGIITETDYKGKTLEEATKYAEQGGFLVRIVEENGISIMLDMSVKSDRINFRVKNGFVVAAFGG
jgi:phosphosulfolactate synthase (CoM biosynthesis protein A)